MVEATTANGEVGVVLTIKAVEMHAMANRALNMLEDYDLTNISISANRGGDDGKPFCYVRLVDMDGHAETYTIDLGGGF